MFSTRTLRYATLNLCTGFERECICCRYQHDYDHNANFRSYHTFSFYKVQTPIRSLNRGSKTR